MLLFGRRAREEFSAWSCECVCVRVVYVCACFITNCMNKYVCQCITIRLCRRFSHSHLSLSCVHSFLYPFTLLWKFPATLSQRLFIVASHPLTETIRTVRNGGSRTPTSTFTDSPWALSLTPRLLPITYQEPPVPHPSLTPSISSAPPRPPHLAPFLPHGAAAV